MTDPTDRSTDPLTPEAALRRLTDAVLAYSPREDHDWRCEYRTAEAGWLTPGGPPVIRCECGFDDLGLAVRDATATLDAARASASTPTEASASTPDHDGFAADRPTGPRTAKGHALASSLRRRLPEADIDYDGWIRDVEAEAAARASASTPDAELLADGRRWREAEVEGHVVTFSADGYGLMHPPSCRPALIECRFNRWLADASGPDADPGRYRMTWAEDEPQYERLVR